MARVEFEYCRRSCHFDIRGAIFLQSTLRYQELAGVYGNEKHSGTLLPAVEIVMKLTSCNCVLNRWFGLA